MAHHIIKYILRIILLAIVFLSIPISYIYASESLTMESKVKAAFIYNFAKFVDWPLAVSNDTQSQPFIIGVIGYNPLIEDLMSIEGKTIKGRKLIVRQLSNIREMNNCQVVYISASEKDNLTGILNAAKSNNILTVSDMGNFVENGGIIGFVKVENKIRFDINLKTAGESHLKIRSDLLALARRIIN